MYIKALNDILPNLKTDPSYMIPEEGGVIHNMISHVTLDKRGVVVGIEIFSKGVPTTVRQMPGTKRTGTGIFPQAGYARGFADGFCLEKFDEKTGKSKGSKRSREAFQKWIEIHENHARTLNDVPESLASFIAHLKKWAWMADSNEHVAELLKHTGLDDIKKLPAGGVMFSVGGGTLHTESWAEDMCSDTSVPTSFSSRKVMCQITMTETDPALLHPQIKLGKPQPLTSVNKSAFTSMGNESGEIASIGIQAAKNYGDALNALILHNGRKTHTQNIAGTTYVFWTAPDPQATDTTGLSAIFGTSTAQDEGKLKEVKAALSAANKGFNTPAIPVSCHILGLRPATGRTSVTLYATTTPQQLSDNLTKHERDTTHLYRIRPNKKLWSLVSATDMTDAETISTLRAILDNTPYPEAACIRALLRIKLSSKISLEANRRRDKYHDQTLEARVQLLTGWLTRNKGNRNYMKTSPYKLGKFLRLAESAQRYANNGTLPDKGVVQRFGTLLSERPSVGFPSLVKLYQVHLTKVRSAGKPGLAYALDTIARTLLTETASLPKEYKLEEQAEFWLGYYADSTEEESSVEHQIPPSPPTNNL
jgi:hypothetical protein